MMHGVIYGLHDPQTNELRYIGQTRGPLRARVHAHVTRSKSGNTYVANWLRTLATEPNVSIIERVRADDLNEREIFWIKHHREAGARLTNIERGGGGKEHSLPTRHAISIALKGRSHTNPTCQCAACSPRRHSDETRAKISKAMKERFKDPAKRAACGTPGRVVSDATRSKMSDARKRYWATRRGEAV